MEQSKQTEKAGTEPEKSLKEKVKDVFNEAVAQKRPEQERSSLVKFTMIAGAGVIVLWGSKYAFQALAGAIRAFKELKRSIKEK